MAAKKKSGKNEKGSGRTYGTYTKKTRQWALLGDYVTKRGAARYMKILEGLDDEAFMDRYEKILGYFKPKQMQGVFDLQTEVHIEVINPNSNIVEEITDGTADDGRVYQLGEGSKDE